jgi:hypothetical protein
MQRILFLAILFGFSAAQAQQNFYAFGPKAGQPIPTEEQKQNQYQADSLQQMKQIGDALKAQQDSTAQQLELLKQQNQMLMTIAQQLQYQSQLLAAQQAVPTQQVAPVQQYAPAQ